MSGEQFFCRCYSSIRPACPGHSIDCSSPLCSALESELATQIASQKVKGRIDSYARALLSQPSNARAETYQAALSAAESYLRNTKSLLLRAAMMRHDMVQRSTSIERPERPDRPDKMEGPMRLGRGREGREGRRGRGGDKDRMAGMFDSQGEGSGSFEIPDLNLTSLGAMLAE